ncbi:hypothetical protein NE237_028618 [Protea cynaroides]|uniref:Protein kinase domain-containing protein n=1 Tax=Protea cynaroides TaxID=273540 RepID=A0A9Q0GPP5_9MAGN|nr:hypothetical protein NE237_028618 [Protea cynaroides]
MTNSFKEKVGQGGCGGVFKGKLPDSRDGKEFINEVISISRISHVNVVSLLGFCFDGSKRALVYEFMSNGSLEKFIYKTSLHLGWEGLYQVATGITPGLEYLPRGCNTRILHFDIKPHNSLLDEDFYSIMSMADARGTIGYITPKVFSRNFGGVSHQSNVYSYGMMLIEMVGGQTNIDAGVDHTSEIFLPHWIYKHIGQGELLQLDMVVREEEEEIARKMVLVGLCQLACQLEHTQVLHPSRSAEESLIQRCSPFHSNCGNSNINYPFSKDTKWECELSIIRCINNSTPQLISSDEDLDRFEVNSIDYTERLYNFFTPNSGHLSFQLVSPINIYFRICPKGDHDTFANENHDEHGLWGGRGISGEVDNILRWLSSGFNLQWNLPQQCHPCDENGSLCLSEHNKGNQGHFICAALTHGSSFLAIVMITLVAILLFYWRRKSSSNGWILFWKRSTKNTQNVEAFLRNYGSLTPNRYSYPDVKKITNSFRDKVGQGGYGGVSKGKLPIGHLVVVKVLNESKGNGKEFINEVTSSRTSHVNVVKSSRLFSCAMDLLRSSSPKHALTLVGKDYQVAIGIAGIAKGLEYLHRGCNTRILHFNIKPHSILLDDDFCPKISDFSLAKLCPTKNSIISMADARGTIGYITPKVFSQNFDAGVEHTSKNYFSDWIYKHNEQGEHLQLDMILREKEEEIGRKMALVGGLWCIQMDPTNRPSISRVVDMLEGNLESLSIPSKPCVSSPTRELADSCTSSITS